MGGAKGTMTISMIKMYESMIEQEFAPVISLLEARGRAVRDSITIEVKKELGVYDLLLKKASLKAQLEEVDASLKRRVGARRREDGTHRSDLELEIERRMEQINTPLVEAKSFKESLLREIRLSSGTPEVRALFDRLQGEIASWMKRIEALPPIETKELSEKDREVLSLGNF